MKKKEQLYEIRKHILEGVMLRSRCRYEDLGEKPTSYFLNLEKRNFTNKVITKIIDDDKEWCYYICAHFAKISFAPIIHLRA